MKTRVNSLRMVAVLTALSIPIAAVASLSGGTMYQAISAIGFLGSVTCWIGAASVWASMENRSSGIQRVWFPTIVVFGFLIGWLYILLYGRDSSRIPSIEG